jgi:ABC-type branched-subunit amino acid transport system substrate-binding protein
MAWLCSRPYSIGSFPPAANYSAIVSKIKDAGADYLMWGGLHTEGGLILRQMRDQGMNTIMISGDGITDSEFAAIAGRAWKARS